MAAPATHPFEQAVSQFAGLWRRGAEPQALIAQAGNLLDEARKREDPEAEATMLMMLGRLQRALDQPAEASQHLVSAFSIFKRIEHHFGLVLTALELVQLTLAAGRAEAVRSLVDMASDVLQNADPGSREYPLLGAAVLQAEALAALDSGETQQTQKLVEQALKLMTRHNQPHEQGYRALKSNIIGTLAMLEANNGRWLEAERQARRAAMLLDPKSYPAEIAQLRRIQAVALRRLSRLQEAEERQREVVQHFARLHRLTEEVEALTELSRILNEQGRAEEAETTLGEAMSKLQVNTESRTRAEALHVAGLVRASAGDTQGAEALIETAASMREQLGDQAGLSDSLRALAVLLQRGGDAAGARQRLTSALDAAGSRSLPRARTLLDLARNPETPEDEAITSLMEADTLTRGTDESLLRVEILIELSERMVNAGRNRAASDLWMDIERLIDVGDTAAAVRAALYTSRRKAMTGDHHEALRLCNWVLERLASVEGTPDHLRGLRSRAMHLGGKVCGIAGILEEAERWLGMARDEARSERDILFEAECLSDLAQLALIRQQAEKGETLAREGMQVATEHQDSKEYLQCLRACGIALARQNRFEEAHSALDHYALLCRKRADHRLEAEALADLSELFVERNPDYARRLAENGLSVADQVRHFNAAGRCRMVLARLWLDRRGHARARQLLEEAVADFGNAGDPLGQSSALYLLGQTLVILGDPSAGLELLQRALGIVQSRGLDGPAGDIKRSIEMLLRWQQQGH